jgi:cytochrome oxidase Cu insertion factor (SCO1/SenC/PrrC family)
MKGARSFAGPEAGPAPPGTRESCGAQASSGSEASSATRGRPGTQGRSGGRARLPGQPLAHSPRKATIGMATLVLAMAGGGALIGTLTSGGPSSGPTASQLSRAEAPLPAAPNRQIPASNAALMDLATLGGKKAPDFALTDQRGTTISLSSLDASHAVVLSFIDDRGSDVGPVLAKELLSGYRDLGPEGPRAYFVAVNLDAAYNEPIWLRKFIAGHGLGALPFYYLTGSPAQLRQVWGDYGIQVQVGAPGGQISHSEAIFFIAPGGIMRYRATPYANMANNGTGWLPAATVSQWGRGIAQYVRAMLR